MKSETVEIEIELSPDETNPGFWVAVGYQGSERLGLGKTRGMALAAALQKIADDALKVERGLRSRMSDDEKRERGL